MAKFQTKPDESTGYGNAVTISGSTTGYFNSSSSDDVDFYKLNLSVGSHRVFYLGDYQAGGGSLAVAESRIQSLAATRETGVYEKVVYNGETYYQKSTGGSSSQTETIGGVSILGNIYDNIYISAPRQSLFYTPDKKFVTAQFTGEYYLKISGQAVSANPDGSFTEEAGRYLIAFETLEGQRTAAWGPDWLNPAAGGGGNRPPVVESEVAQTSGETITVNVLANDSDPDGDPLTAVILPPAKGTASIDATGLVTYTPKARFTQDDVGPDGTVEDTIAYFVTDGHGNTTPGSLTVTIALPQLSVSPAVPRKLEGDDGTTNMVFKLYLSEPAANDVEFAYETAPLKAQAGLDYVPQSGTFTIRAGQDYAEISVPIVGDRDPEGAEDFNLVIGDVVNALLPGGAASQPFRGVIVDDDQDVDVPIDDIAQIAPDIAPEDEAAVEGLRPDAIDLVDISVKLDKPVQKLLQAIGKEAGDTTVTAKALNNLNALDVVSNAVKIAKAYEIVEAAWNAQAPADGEDSAAWGDASQKLAVLVGSSIVGRVGGTLIIGALTPLLGTVGAVAVGAVASVAVAGTVQEAVTTLVTATSNRFASDGDENTAWQGPEDATGSSRSPFTVAVGDKAPEPQWEYDPVTKTVTWLTPLTDDVRFHLDATAARMGLPTETPIPFSYTGHDPVAGGTGDDVFTSDGGPVAFLGRGGADTLTGGAGADRLDGGTGSDLLKGGAGDDVYFVDDPGDRVVEAKNEGTDTVYSTISYALSSGQAVERLFAADPGATTALNLTGNEFDNILRGNAGANVLDGKGGADAMHGGAGDDVYAVDDAGDQVFEAKGEGNDLVVSTVSYTLAAGQEIETLQLAKATGGRKLFLTGNEFAQILRGNGGANVLDGGGGADAMYGRAGDDVYAVDDAGDQVFELRGEGNDLVVSTVSYMLAAGQEIETLQLAKATGSANLNLTGNEFAQVLRGNAGANVLDGKGGADAMYGGAGDDVYAIDNAGDRVFEAAGGGKDMLVTTVSYALAAGQEVETMQFAKATGSANLSLEGNEFGQLVMGNAGANKLNGGLGNDVLTGRGGADTFVFTTKLGPDNVDHITDFASEDTIRLAKSIFKAIAAGELSASAFKDLGVAGASVDADDRIVYDSRTGVLAYDADGSGAGAAVTFAILDNKAALTHGDFLIA